MQYCMRHFNETQQRLIYYYSPAEIARRCARFYVWLGLLRKVLYFLGTPQQLPEG